MANIVWLKQIGKADGDVAGGKGANLAEMFNSGFPVPPAFIITAQAYQKFIFEEELEYPINQILSSLNIENTAELEDKSEEIRKMIVNAQIPKDLEKEILEAYESLNITEDILKESKGLPPGFSDLLKAGKEPAFVAVRSSATTEDLATASFAGQQETFLNIKGNDDLLEAVKKCWASLFTARAVYYRQRKGFKHETAFLAVVVQRMVNADKAGVIFTIDPLTNANEVVIEAAFGLGEGVVSGSVAPDHYVFDKNTLNIKSKEIKKKNIFFAKNSSGKTIKSEVPVNMRMSQALEDREIEQLGKIAIKIENHYGKPQDIEFAIEAGALYIVQSRPITTAGNELKTHEEIKANAILEGLPASPGIASGKVKIVYSLNDLTKVVKGDILVTKMTNPDMVVTMQKCSAIVTDEGGSTAHAAIVSREMGIPCVVGTMKATSVLNENQIITVDGSRGKIYQGAGEGIQEAARQETKPAQSQKQQQQSQPQQAQPQKQQTQQQKQQMQQPQQQQYQQQTTKYFPTKTKIYMNLGEPEKISKYKDLYFDGIGLMRVEFIIASQIGKHPLYLLENHQEQEYIDKLADGISIVAKTIAPKPLVVRFSDFKSNEYKSLKGGEKFELHEENPMIGFRGVSRYISEQFREAFKLECKAIKKVLQQSNNVWVMLPFVRTGKEVRECIEILKSQGLQRSNTFKIWLMAEVPSMSFMADKFAELDIDGVSIGSNDLTQLVLGVDRDSALLGRMGYFDERNPAVLRAMKRIIKNFREKGKTVSICGQAPSVYPEIVEFLIKEGVTSVSINPDTVNTTRELVSKVENKLKSQTQNQNQQKQQQQSNQQQKQQQNQNKQSSQKPSENKKDESKEMAFEEIKPFEAVELDSIADIEDKN